LGQVPTIDPRLGIQEHPIRVLLVDDQRIVGEAVRRMLAGRTPEIDVRRRSNFAFASTPMRPSPSLPNLAQR
jgi:hypothetical protein